jgi:hypothetical protein
MPRAKTNVQTPGETPTADQAGQAAGDAFQAEATQTSVDQTEQAAAGDSEIAQLKAMVIAQNATIASLTAAVSNVQRTQPTPTAKSLEASLPDLDSVDVDAINAGNTPVLTKQGWIVPPTYGTDPARLQELRDAALQRQVMGDLAKKLVN